MQETLILDHLAQLNLSNRYALQLRADLVKIIEENISIPVRKGSIDLTWLAGRIGATRQIFYPGRGSPEVLQLLGVLNQHIVDNSQATARVCKQNIDHTRLQIELTLMRRENSTLKQQLRLVRHEQEIMHASGIILGDLE